MVKKANREMLFYVYGAAIVLCFLTFRSVASVVCAVLPLMLTSILCEAFMFIWNMVGALVLMPALAYFLLPKPKLSEEAESARVTAGEARAGTA